MTPTRKLLWLGAPFVVLALLIDVGVIDVAVLQVLLALAIAVLIWDVWQLWRSPLPSIQRVIDAQLPVQAWMPVRLKLDYQLNRALAFEIHDLYDESWAAKSMPQTVSFNNDGEANVDYQIKASKRGAFSITGVDLLLHSPLGLWDRRKRIALESHVRVQPNYKDALEFSLLGDEQRLARLGMRQQRRRGEGTEFHQLREYQSGDSMRKIDWKASSRIGKLISKEYQDEQDQQLVFLLDTGRRMRHKDEHSEHLDHAMNAMLLVSHVASQQGDAVGFMAFGEHHNWCPPIKHPAIVKHLVDHCYNLDSGLVMSDYLLAAQRLLELQKRRSLVMILTNSRDEDREDLEKAIVLLRKKHLVVVADLHESFIDNTLQQSSETFVQALELLSVQAYLQSRKEMHHSLSGLGALCIDCQAKDLPAKLVSSYQQIKHTGRL